MILRIDIQKDKVFLLLGIHLDRFRSDNRTPFCVTHREYNQLQLFYLR